MGIAARSITLAYPALPLAPQKNRSHHGNGFRPEMPFSVLDPTPARDGRGLRDVLRGGGHHSQAASDKDVHKSSPVDRESKGQSNQTTWTTLILACTFTPILIRHAPHEEIVLTTEFGEDWQEYSSYFFFTPQIVINPACDQRTQDGSQPEQPKLSNSSSAG